MIIATVVLGVILARIIISMKTKGASMGKAATDAIDGLDLTTT